MKTWKIVASVVSLTVILSTTNIYSQSAGGRGMGRMQNPPTFTSYDLNSDGVITETEFNKAREARREARAKSGGMMRNTKNAPSFESIDTNNDGEISAEEFSKHQADYQGTRRNW